MSRHDSMPVTEIDACRCSLCCRESAAVGVGESMVEIAAALEWLPRQVALTERDPETYLTVLRFVADFHALRSLLVRGVDK